MLKKIIYIFILLTFPLGKPSGAIFAQQPTPAPKQTKSILLVGATAHIGNGTVIEKSLIGFKDGKLTLVKPYNDNYKNEEYEEIIDITGKHIYPGLISANSTLGLVEIESVRATRDFADVVHISPNVRAQIAYNTDSKIIPTIRSNGILTAQITPKSNIIPGTSAILEMDGWNWEDATLKADDGVHINWPTMSKKNGWWAEQGATGKNSEYDKVVSIIKKFITDVKAYNTQQMHAEKDLRAEAMRGVINGTQNLFVHVNGAKEITDALLTLKALGIKKVVLVGAKDCNLALDIIKKYNAPIILTRLHDLPERPEDDVNCLFKLPKILKDNGVFFCLNNEGDMEAMNTRNLSFIAGTAVAYGLTKEEALSTITLNVAKILEIDNLIGSLEVGKYATLFVSDGDILDMKTNNVTLAFIRGKKIDLNNEQKMLYNIYSEKYK